MEKGGWLHNNSPSKVGELKERHKYYKRTSEEIFPRISIEMNEDIP